MIDQAWYIVRPLPERGHLDHEDRDPVVEVLPEQALRDSGLEVLVGRGDEPDVRPDGLRPAHLGELARLNDAKELGLQRRAQLAELVDEQRPGVGQREDALAMLRRAGEGSLHVTEEMTLHQAFRNCRAVERDQGTIAAGTRVVDRARDQLLAGAALAVDADVHIADRHLVDARKNLGHLRRFANDAVIDGGDRRGLVHEPVDEQGQYQANADS